MALYNDLLHRIYYHPTSLARLNNWFQIMQLAWNRYLHIWPIKTLGKRTGLQARLKENKPTAESREKTTPNPTF